MIVVILELAQLLPQSITLCHDVYSQIESQQNESAYNECQCD